MRKITFSNLEDYTTQLHQHKIISLSNEEFKYACDTCIVRRSTDNKYYIGDVLIVHVDNG